MPLLLLLYIQRIHWGVLRLCIHQSIQPLVYNPAGMSAFGALCAELLVLGTAKASKQPIFEESPVISLLHPFILFSER